MYQLFEIALEDMFFERDCSTSWSNASDSVKGFELWNRCLIKPHANHKIAESVQVLW